MVNPNTTQAMTDLMLACARPLVDPGTELVGLTNATGALEVGGRRIAFAGVDDSHLKRDRYDEVAGPADPSADVRIGLAHSP